MIHGKRYDAPLLACRPIGCEQGERHAVRPARNGECQRGLWLEWGEGGNEACEVAGG
jgi:hypothetical protein